MEKHCVLNQSGWQDLTWMRIISLLQLTVSKLKMAKLPGRDLNLGSRSEPRRRAKRAAVASMPKKIYEVWQRWFRKWGMCVVWLTGGDLETGTFILFSWAAARPLFRPWCLRGRWHEAPSRCKASQRNCWRSTPWCGSRVPATSARTLEGGEVWSGNFSRDRAIERCCAKKFGYWSIKIWPMQAYYSPVFFSKWPVLL